MKQPLIILIAVILSFQIKGSCSAPRVLVLMGGHDYDTTAFYDMFCSLEGIRFDTMSYPGLPELLQSTGLDYYDLLIHYHYYPDASEEDSSMYEALTREGVPMLFLHHSICSYQKWKGYARIIGGRYVMPGYTADSSLLADYAHDLNLHVSVVDQYHPVTQNLADFDIVDEGYSNIQLEDGIVPLLRTFHPECSPLVGWTFQYNHSTTVYLLFGHDHQAYQNPSFRKLLRNTIFWLTDNPGRSK